MTCVLCVTYRRRAETKQQMLFVSQCGLARTFKAGMKVARSPGKASSVFGPSLAKQTQSRTQYQ